MKFSPYATEADAKRAIVRAKRWIRNQSKGPLHAPPNHIYFNAELAAAQFGDSVAN